MAPELLLAHPLRLYLAFDDNCPIPLIANDPPVGNGVPFSDLLFTLVSVPSSIGSFLGRNDHPILAETNADS
jgi:hypothetical protein